ncbi:MAG: extracellular solute-binding protein, partial [Planctomycetota bacterium]
MFLFFWIFWFFFGLISCHQQPEMPVVVVYTSHDRIYSLPIFQLFEKKTGIRVLADYDTEANKSVGMVTKLINEKDYPKCDIYWNNQVERTIQLKKKGVLAPLSSSELSALDSQFMDPERYWIGFAARARVFIYNTTLLSKDQLPQSILELTQPQWKGKFAMAYPLFGTTASHAAALFHVLGESRAKQFFDDLQKNEVNIADG